MIREDDIIERSLYESVFPGIVCRVWKDGKLLYERVAGYREFETRDKMTLDTIFDLASLTKPLATAVLVMRAIDEHAVSLEQKLGNFFPEAPDTLKQLTIRSLLIHTAGLAQPELNRYFPDPLKIDRKKAREIVLSMQPELPSGSEVLYSCTGYILLGFLLERVSGASLGQLFKEYIWPLRLASHMQRLFRLRTCVCRRPRPNSAPGESAESAEKSTMKAPAVSEEKPEMPASLAL